ncbi:glutathione S-transferase N-terminal domain-containing protein [Methylocapsa aurea]|uniref:glutathione S-transferase N-terminal domain-containing protein n=1 Tax=Methylocapsa aurea TaxID=663610 RepID=UPI00056151B4|nr:glutathione S-transferase N-terminal domain-containing protein [Methylocapsa aurea]
MMMLRSSPASPFGRKVLIAAALAGLAGRIQTVAADTSDPADTIRQQNPLGKIPALILADGTVYFDSRVIVEYLDHLAGGDVLIPTESEARFRALTLAALADGIADAALLLVYEERLRDAAKRDPKWVALQDEKIQRGLQAFEKTLPAGRRDIAHIGLACALGYLDLRFKGTWRGDHPHLTQWLEAFAAEVPAFEATRA